MPSLPLAQRVKGWFAGSSTPKIKGPSLWQRIQLSAVGRKLAGSSQPKVKGGFRGWVRNTWLMRRLRSSEGAETLRTRKQAREVQRRIRERDVAP